jgi:uncharacterized protein Yka (UPF0111/DUF47 family)
MDKKGNLSSPWFGSIFEPKTDFFNLLTEQAEKTLAGVKALGQWLNDGGNDRCQIVKDIEREADTLKLQLGHKLFESYITPFDREDIYDLSLHLDEVINAAKAIVREMEACEVSSDNQYLKNMSFILVEGTESIRNSFANLKVNLKESTVQAELARKSENRLTKMYRLAIKELFAMDDLKTIIRIKEVYRSMLAAAERIDIVGEKLLLTIMKMG